MTRPAAVPFRGRDKWVEVGVDLLLAVAGVGLVAVAVPALSGTEPLGLWLLVVHTVVAVALTVLLAAVVAVTRQLPTLTEGEVDGRRATGVRAWWAPWWHTCALDACLAATGAALAVVGLVAGGAWAVTGALVGLVGAWFAVRVALVGLGRRRRPALWLTDTEVVVDSGAGRARAPRSAVRRVRSRGRRVVVELDAPARRETGPRAWRPARVSDRVLELDAADVGHRAGLLADWLGDEIGVPGTIETSSAG